MDRPILWLFDLFITDFGHYTWVLYSTQILFAQYKWSLPWSQHKWSQNQMIPSPRLQVIFSYEYRWMCYGICVCPEMCCFWSKKCFFLIQEIHAPSKDLGPLQVLRTKNFYLVINLSFIGSERLEGGRVKKVKEQKE